MLKNISKIICEFVNAEPDSISEETMLYLDLGLSSFDLINIAVEVEEKFGVQISNRELALMKSVGDIIGRIEAA